MSTENDIKLVLTLVQRLEDKIDKVQETQTEQGIIQAENTVILRQHEQRSTKLEDWVSKIYGIYLALEQQVKEVVVKVNTIEESEATVTTHINKINSYLSVFKAVPKILKFVLLVGGVVSTIYGAYVFFHKG